MEIVDPPQYKPDFESECYIQGCGRSPTVIVIDHVVPHTDLCGIHFFGDLSMGDWTNWNDPRDATQ